MDRHMLGLRLAARHLNKPVPALLSHAAYKRLMHFQLSTSQVSTRHDGLMSYGSSFNDDYGVCYNPQPAKINVSVASYRSCFETSSEKYVDQGL